MGDALIIAVVYAILVFFLLMGVLRVLGKRELSEMSAFDLVILFVIGDLIAEAVVAEDTSFSGAFTAVATFALLTIAISWLSFRFPRLEPEGIILVVHAIERRGLSRSSSGPGQSAREATVSMTTASVRASRSCRRGGMCR